MWLFFFCAFCLFMVQYTRYYYLGYYKQKKHYEYAWKELDKVARQIVVGFILFIIATYTLCLHKYEVWL